MELRCGEYGQPWKKIFEVENQSELAGVVDEYLATYYDGGHTVDDGVHYFNCGEVAVQFEQAEKIESFEQLINALR